MRDEAGRLARYGIVGVVSNLVLYAAFVGLLWLGVPPLPAAGLCYVAGVALSYLLNRSWTFGSRNGHGHDLPRFLLAYAAGLGATLVFLRVLLIWLPAEIAQIVNIGATAIFIYTCLRLLRFGETGHDA